MKQRERSPGNQVMFLVQILFLIFFPLLVGLALLLTKHDGVRKVLVRGAAALIAAASVSLAVEFLSSDATFFAVESPLPGYAMLTVEAALALFIVYMGARRRNWMSIVLTLVQAPALIWYELTHETTFEVQNALFVDRLSILMALVIGIIGSLICVYALGYMKHYHEHGHTVRDRRPFFFFLLFVFLSAMFGIIFSNSLLWLYFFWEITTLCSFLLIGYTKEPVAIKNSFRALNLNLLGGVAFTGALIYLADRFQTVDLANLLAMGLSQQAMLLPVLLLCLAGMVKAAQMPFSSWLLGAMVAPTPTSALLHSSTMVKAGVYLIIRLAPGLGDTIPGILATYIGGLTFLLASLAAISQSDGKKILAYSTIANLGLIVTCAGLGNYEAVWVAILLILFHAVAKSLMFLSVGTVEHTMGSRDIEDMKGLIVHMPRVSILMVVGIAGMFLAPFGMLISKWAAMKAFVDSNQVMLLIMLVFGSSATLFYWTKWLGSIMTVPAVKKKHKYPSPDEWFAIGLHAVLTIAVCTLFPLVSSHILAPYLQTIFHESFEILRRNDVLTMLLMLGMILVLPLSFILTGGDRSRRVDVYMAGENTGDNMSYHASLGRDREVQLSNWYMGNYLGEQRLNLAGTVATAAFIVVMFAILMTKVI